MNNENNNLNGTTLDGTTNNNLNQGINPTPNVNQFGNEQPIANDTLNNGEAPSNELNSVGQNVNNMPNSTNPFMSDTPVTPGEREATPIPTFDNNLNLGGNTQMPQQNSVNPTPTGLEQPTPNMEPQVQASVPLDGLSNSQDSNLSFNLGAQSTPSTPMEPAFSDPQTIMPNNNPTSFNLNNNAGAMPGFESSGTIGTTPPLSFDKEPQQQPVQPPKPKKSKVGFILIIIIVLALIGFGTFYVLKYTNILNTNSGSIKIETKNFEINLGDKLPEDINEYATITGTNNPASCTVNKDNIDTTKAGMYEFTVSCGGVQKNGTVTIVDNSDLEIELKEVTKVKGNTLEANEFAMETNSDYNYEFVNEDEVKKNLEAAGEYEVKIKVTDTKTKKTTEATGKLLVTDYDIRGYLVCSTNPQTVTGTSATMTVRNRFAIANNGNSNIYGGLAYEIHEFTFTDESEFTNYYAAYNTGSEVKINDITSKDIKFDNSSKTITMTNHLSNETLNTQYGADNMATYSSIRNYFGQTLGQSCVYEQTNNNSNNGTTNNNTNSNTTTNNDNNSNSNNTTPNVNTNTVPSNNNSNSQTNNNSNNTTQN